MVFMSWISGGNTQPAAKVQHYEVLDSLRGICAVMVVLFHFRANSHLDPAPLIRNSWLFVDFFFVLSGFVITASYHERLITKSVSLRVFLIRRFKRLYPLHIFMLAIFVLTELLIFLLEPVLGGISRKPFADSHSLSLLPENVFLLQSLNISGEGSWNVPAWSISAEMWTYLVFAIAVVCGRAGRFFFYTATLVGVPLIILIFHGGTLTLEADGGVLRCLMGFGLGSLLYHYFKTPPSVTALTGHLEGPMIVAVILFVWAAPGLGVTMLAPLIFAAAIWIFVNERGPISAFLKHRIFLLLGALSYSIYMTHTYLHARLTDIFQISERWFDMSFFSDSAGRFFGKTLFAGDLFVLFGLALTIGISWLTYTYIERPGQRIPFAFISRWKKQRGNSNG